MSTLKDIGRKVSLKKIVRKKISLTYAISTSPSDIAWHSNWHSPKFPTVVLYKAKSIVQQD